ncbi:TetR/AcrR family transcriptional regulator [Streptacidiphilus neutrinimicus]|uniref:TetR/AcrR family transcriptional regulator n=1 Tax=Streptacidiphilus neutrinimicus TaxID=105420 RepID=UPI0005AB15C7|nr:TetR/AcrR family transcriptional regulator [Streptacidiphilus neutrinimicus]
MTQATARQATAGRGRLTPEREAELYEHVIALVREHGYDSLTMDAVAARAHVSKATLYRQWREGKPELVASAMRHTKPLPYEGIDTGSLRGDLFALADAGTDLEDDTVFMSAVMHAVQANEDLGAALRAMLVEPMRRVLEQVIDRAVERGEVRAGAAAGKFLAHALVGALPARKILDDTFADPDYMKAYVDAVVLPALLNS